MRRRLAASALALALLAGIATGLSACSDANDDLVDQYEQGDGQGFISGDGRVQEIAIADRGDPVEFTGTAVDGSTITSDDFENTVLVLNFWYAGCGPCRAEAELLESTFETYADEGVQFLGVNIYDGPEQATAFEEKYGITYPSLLAADDADLKLAFASWTPLQSVPITLVLDTQGRVAARFIGAVQDDTSLPTIVGDVLAEDS
ncbi:MAG: TlpA disulfide reductase family protein [Microbacterium sp.]